MGRKGPESSIDQALDSLGNELQGILWNLIGRPGSGEVEADAPTRILFTSTEEGAGTTTLAVCLAVEIARNLGVETTVMEVNTVKPTIAGFMDCSSVPGVSDVLDGEATPDEVIRASEVPLLRIIPGGTPRQPIPGEWGTDRGRALIEEVTRDSRFLIVDAPPLLEHGSMRLLLSFCDAAVIVLRAGISSQDDAKEIVQGIQSLGTKVAGVILNHC